MPSVPVAHESPQATRPSLPIRHWPAFVSAQPTRPSVPVMHL